MTMNYKKGEVGLGLVFGLLIISAVLPLSLKLVQQDQELRRGAAADYPILNDTKTRELDDCVALEYISPYCQEQCGGDKSYKLWSWHEPGEEPAGWFGLPAGQGMPLFNWKQKDDCREPKIGHQCATKEEMRQGGLSECVPYPDSGSGDKITPDEEVWQCVPQQWQLGACGGGECDETEKLRVRSFMWEDPQGNTHGTCGAEIEEGCVFSEDCPTNDQPEEERDLVECRLRGTVPAIKRTNGFVGISVYAMKEGSSFDTCPWVKGVLENVKVTLNNPNSGSTWTGTTDSRGSVTLGPLDEKVYQLECFGTKCRRKDGEYYNFTLEKDGFNDGKGSFYVIPGEEPEANLDFYTLPQGYRFVPYGGTVELKWKAQGVDSCQASGDWSGDKPVVGTFKTEAIFSAKTYVLTCRNDRDGTTLTESIEIGIQGSSGGGEDQQPTPTIQLAQPTPTPAKEEKLIEKSVPGDANNDGDVDVTDFSIWRKEKYDQGADKDQGDWQADFTGDGLVKNDDFSIWMNNFK